jgi:hypothetical protein
MMLKRIMIVKVEKMVNDEGSCLLDYNAVQFGENPKLSKFGLSPHPAVKTRTNNRPESSNIEEDSEGYGKDKQWHFFFNSFISNRNYSDSIS